MQINASVNAKANYNTNSKNSNDYTKYSMKKKQTSKLNLVYS